MPFLTPWGDNRTYLIGLRSAIPGTQSNFPMVFHWVQSLTRILNLEESTASKERFWLELVKRVKELMQIRTEGQRDTRWECWLGKGTRCRYISCEHLKRPLSRVSSSCLQNAAKCQLRTRGYGVALFLGGLWNINSPFPENLAGGRA